MNTENEFNSSPKKNYKQLHRILKSKCEDISKVIASILIEKFLFMYLSFVLFLQENEALSSRLLNIKLLIYKAENQCRYKTNNLFISFCNSKLSFQTEKCKTD
jgi:hypothetical protein